MILLATADSMVHILVEKLVSTTGQLKRGFIWRRLKMGENKGDPDLSIFVTFY